MVATETVLTMTESNPFERPCWGGPCSTKGMAEAGFCKCKEDSEVIQRYRKALEIIAGQPQHVLEAMQAKAALTNIANGEAG